MDPVSQLPRTLLSLLAQLLEGKSRRLRLLQELPLSLEGIQKVPQFGSLLRPFAPRDSWISYPTSSPPLASEPSGMLIEMTVPSRSSFDQQGACLADRSPAHEPQADRAGSESLFTCFRGLRG